MSLIIRLLQIVLGVGIGTWVASGLAKRVRIMAQPDFFAGKVVLITGASRGIGREMALAFAARGANLVLAARHQEQLLALASECSAQRPGIQTLAVPTDVTDDGQLHHLVERAIDHFERIDILMNNAGILMGGPLLEMGPEALRRQIDVNLIGAMRLIQLVLPHMVKQGSGHIVNLASAAGRHSYPYFVTYSITKHGLIALGDGLRRELAGSGIHVMTVSPGYTATDMVSEVGSVWRRMGLRIIPVREVVQSTLNGLVTGAHEVHVGFFYRFAGWANLLFPRLTDLYWRLIPPRDYPQIARRQRSE